jgi:transcription elongation factor GreA
MATGRFFGGLFFFLFIVVQASTDQEATVEMITPQERELILAKLEELKSRRQDISKRIAEARAQGDLKENADYHAARDDQGLNEAEIRRLEDRVKNAHVADADSIPADMVHLGSIVRLKDLSDDSDDLYKLVGEATGRFDADEIEVTVSSPMGESLLKARVGETIRVDLPRGVKRFEILEIK